MCGCQQNRTPQSSRRGPPRHTVIVHAPEPNPNRFRTGMSGCESIPGAACLPGRSPVKPAAPTRLSTASPRGMWTNTSTRRGAGIRGVSMINLADFYNPLTKHERDSHHHRQLQRHEMIDTRLRGECVGRGLVRGKQPGFDAHPGVLSTADRTVLAVIPTEGDQPTTRNVLGCVPARRRNVPLTAGRPARNPGQSAPNDARSNPTDQLIAQTSLSRFEGASPNDQT